jgi:hypothetical protein
MKRTGFLTRSDGKSRASVPAPKTKKCRVCKAKFMQMRPMQAVCGGPCAAIDAVTKRQKAERAADRAKREKLKPRSQWLREAQAAFNRFIRSRDAALPCVSCGTFDGKINAGHYLSTGARPELRFDEANVHKQCERCNTYLHGNLIPYRAELIRRLGLSEVERLEGPQEPRKYTADDLKAIRDKYRAETQRLIRGGQA